MRKLRLVVHEHETLVVGAEVTTSGGETVSFDEKTFDLLARFVERTRSPAFALGYRKLTAKHHVGYLAVGPISIEILPKLARRSDLPWRDLLVHMINEVADVRLAMGTTSPLQKRPRDLHELLVARFLDLTERIVREGLLRSYREVEENGCVLRGRILMPQHVRANAARHDRVYTAYEVWDEDNTPNRMLHAALDVVARTSARWDLVRRAEDGRASFPEFDPRALRRDALRKLTFDRRTARYREALTLARMILFGERPDLRWGDHDIVSLLFDMNHLFEAYVAVQLRRIDGLEVRTQARLPFWRGEDGGRRILKPDVIARITATGETIVIDTKWKEPRDRRPSDDDLRQLYAYIEHVGATRGILMYPTAVPPEVTTRGTFDRSGSGACAWVPLMTTNGRPSAEAVRAALSAVVRGNLASSGLSWDDVQAVALSFNGYEYAGSFDDAARIAEQVSHDFRGGGPKAIRDRPTDDVRCSLFFEQRSWRAQGDEPDAASLAYLQALVEELRARLGLGWLRAAVSPKNLPGT